MTENLPIRADRLWHIEVAEQNPNKPDLCVTESPMDLTIYNPVRGSFIKSNVSVPIRR